MFWSDTSPPKDWYYGTHASFWRINTSPSDSNGCGNVREWRTPDMTGHDWRVWDAECRTHGDSKPNTAKALQLDPSESIPFSGSTGVWRGGTTGCVPVVRSQASQSSAARTGASTGCGKRLTVNCVSVLVQCFLLPCEHGDIRNYTIYIYIYH